MSRPHFLQPLLSKSQSEAALYVREQQAPIATKLQGAFDSATRRRGLLGRAAMAPDEALIIAPCGAVHTFKMQFDIDVIYAARDGRIVKLRERLQPSRISAALAAFATIEMAGGSIARARLAVGQRLEIR